MNRKPESNRFKELIFSVYAAKIDLKLLSLNNLIVAERIVLRLTDTIRETMPEMIFGMKLETAECFVSLV